PGDGAAGRNRKGASGRVAGELGAVANLAVGKPQSALVLDGEGLLERLADHERPLRRLTCDAEPSSEQSRPDVCDCQKQDEDIRQRVRKMNAGDPGEEREHRHAGDQGYARGHGALRAHAAIALTPGAGPSSAPTPWPAPPPAPRQR